MNEQPRPGQSRNETTVLILLFSMTLIVGTGIQMGSALFPSLARLLDVPVSTVTLLVSVWAFTGLLSPLFGPPSDRYGHGTFLLIGLGVFALGNLLCAVAPNFESLLLFQVLVGLGYAIESFSATALIGDLFAYEKRARAMAIVRVAVSVVTLAGVPVAAAIADAATARGSFATVGGLGIVLLAVAWAMLPRLSRVAVPGGPTERVNAVRTMMDIARQRSALASLVSFLLWMAIPTGIFIYLAAWLEQNFQLTETQIGLAFATAGIGGLIGNALTAACTDRLGKKRSALAGLGVLSFVVILLPRTPDVPLVLVSLVILMAALEFSVASFVALMTELVPERRGAFMSLVSLANGIGTGLAPLMLRPLWEGGGYAATTLVLGVVGVAVMAIIGLFVAERRPLVASPVPSGE